LLGYPSQERVFWALIVSQAFPARPAGQACLPTGRQLVNQRRFLEGIVDKIRNIARTSVEMYEIWFITLKKGRGKK